MILKFILKVICKIFYILKSIIMRDNQDGRNKLYTFKCLRYERVKPNYAQSVPVPRSGHRIVCDEGNLYLFGGYNPSVRGRNNRRPEENMETFPLFQELWKFNFAAKVWTKFLRSETLPEELASNAVIRQGDYLMVYGGTGAPFGNRCSNQLYICSLKNINGIMTEVNTTGKLPPAQYGQALVYNNNCLYAIGGTTGFSYTCDIHRLNLTSKVWEVLYSFKGDREYEPLGRYRHEVAFDGNKIFILGGGTADEAYEFDNIPVFNIENKEWTQMKTIPDPNTAPGIPQARKCHGAVQIKTETSIQVYVCAGVDAENCYNDLWRLDLKTMQWALINKCQLPRSLYFHSTAVTPSGKMFVFGGIFVRNNRVSRTNETHSVWLVIPKLSEMCWEAITYYNPAIGNKERNQLINEGFPRHFLKRLH